MDKLQIEFEKIVNQTIQKYELDETEFSKLLTETLISVTPKTAKTMLRVIRKELPKGLKERRQHFKDFEKHHKKRWGKALDVLEMLLMLTEEVSCDFDETYHLEGNKIEEATMEALINLHTRALLASKEIFCLLKSGYPDGALARWRSLHEIAVISLFISSYDETISKRYLLSRDVQAYKAMLNLNKFSEKDNLEPFSDEDIQKSKDICGEIVKNHGSEMKNKYGWASPVLNNNKPSFFDLEKNIGLDHWRPYYQWACDYLHANFKPHNSLLGLCEEDEDIQLIGPSIAGLTDPAHITALSLNIVSIALLLRDPNVDRIVIADILHTMADDIGNAFLKIDNVLAP